MKIGDILTVVGYDPDYIYFKNRRLPHTFIMDVWLFKRHVKEIKEKFSDKRRKSNEDQSKT